MNSSSYLHHIWEEPSQPLCGILCIILLCNKWKSYNVEILHSLLPLCFSFKPRIARICISHQHEPLAHIPHLSKSYWFVHRKCTQIPLSVAILRPGPRFHHCKKRYLALFLTNTTGKIYQKKLYKTCKGTYPRFISRYVFMRMHKIGSRGMKGHINPEFCKKKKEKNY